MRRLASGRRGGGGERRFRGEGLGLFGVGSVLWRGGDAQGKKCSGDGGEFDEWTPAMALF